MRDHASSDLARSGVSSYFQVFDPPFRASFQITEPYGVKTSMLKTPLDLIHLSPDAMTRVVDDVGN